MDSWDDLISFMELLLQEPRYVSLCSASHRGQIRSTGASGKKWLRPVGSTPKEDPGWFCFAQENSRGANVFLKVWRSARFVWRPRAQDNGGKMMCLGAGKEAVYGA